MYQVKRASRSEFVPIRNLNYHVWTWGEPTPGVAPLVMVHGWMDVAASYQFVVDALSDAFMRGRHVIALDWRGYGLTNGVQGLTATVASDNMKVVAGQKALHQRQLIEIVVHDQDQGLCRCVHLITSLFSGLLAGIQQDYA